MDKRRVKIGCCGFHTSRRNYYKTFPVVEIQKIFYQPPDPDTVKRWREEAPSEFEFTLKAWQLITHEAWSPTYRRLKVPLSKREMEQAGAFRWSGVVRQAWEKTAEMARLLKAEKIVFQCPPGFKPAGESKENMRRFFSSIHRLGFACIWEPRGAWTAEEISDLCQELDLVHCVDPLKADLATRGLRYYRLHGITGYRHKYTDEELSKLFEHCAGEEANYFLFNNIDMVNDALRFQELFHAG